VTSRGERPAEYEPLTWPDDCVIAAEERATIERCRQDLWVIGVRSEPMLTRMAIEFGVLTSLMTKPVPWVWEGE